MNKRPQLPRRDKMLNAATILFVKNGFDAVSIGDIIKKSGGSRRDIYTYFGNKKGLFFAAIDEIFALSQVDIVSAKDDALDTRKALVKIGERFIENQTSKDAQIAYRLFISESRRFPSLGRRYFDLVTSEYYRQLSQFFQARRDRLTIDDPDRAAILYLEMVKGDIVQRAQLGPKYQASKAEIKAHIVRTVEVFLGGVGDTRSNLAEFKLVQTQLSTPIDIEKRSAEFLPRLKV